MGIRWGRDMCWCICWRHISWHSVGLHLPEEIGHLHPQLGQFLRLADSFSPERCHAFTCHLAIGVVSPSHNVDLLGHFFADGVDAVIIIIAHAGAMVPLTGACVGS